MNGHGARAGMALFATAIGTCGIAWRGGRVIASHLPESNPAETAKRLAARAGDVTKAEPPAVIARAIAGIVALLEGERDDLAFVDCDCDTLDPFNAQVYALARRIPPGQTRTYGDLAVDLGDRLRAQAVGQALGRNPFPIIVPCHRVLGAGGRLTGFSARGGVETKLRILAIEGAQLGDAPSLFDDLPFAVRPGG